MLKRTISACLALAFLGAGSAVAAGHLTAEQAARHIGQKATVCGTVASADYATRSGGKPTFINLDKAYPDAVFTVVIWGRYRQRFATPPQHWHGHLCVTGKITTYHGRPEMDVTSARQVSH